MADLGEENKVSGVFGGVNIQNVKATENAGVVSGVYGGVNEKMHDSIQGNKLPIKTGFWTKFKTFWLQEIKVELTPYQQKVENEINEFLHQEITWEKVHDFLFQEISFGKKKDK